MAADFLSQDRVEILSFFDVEPAGQRAFRLDKSCAVSL
jgi:hypothetical protein